MHKLRYLFPALGILLIALIFTYVQPVLAISPSSLLHQLQDNNTRLAGGSCGFVNTPKLTACLGKLRPTPTPAPVCGNGFCEVGEADIVNCPPCTPGDPCPERPCSLLPGSCPADCTAPTPTPKQ